MFIVKDRDVNHETMEYICSLGFNGIVAQVAAARLADVDKETIRQILIPDLKYIPDPKGLKDITKAAQRLKEAIENKERIGVLTDYDVDGITSHSVIRLCLIDVLGVDKDLITPIIGNRAQTGYGISNSLVDRILAHEKKPRVIISADCGSSDGPRVERLYRSGIDVIITDHHLVPAEGPPEKAYAVVNPSQPACTYSDPTIAGCMVAWLTMGEVVKAMGADHDKYLALLDYVSLGTVADCVSIGKSPANRAVVKAGLNYINKFERPCWRAYRDLVLKDKNAIFNSGSLGFQLGPRINARSRMDDPLDALLMLVAVDDERATNKLSILDADNERRKKVEQTMTNKAKIFADRVEDSLGEKASGITVWLPDGHSGVQGIVASRLVQAKGKPTVVLTPAGEGTITGSARSIPGLNIRDVLQNMADRHPDMFVKFGGHHGAAGMTIHEDSLKTFITEFAETVYDFTDGRQLVPEFMTDGQLGVEEMTIEMVDALDVLQPYGRDMESPKFRGEFIIQDIKRIGHDELHLKARAVPVTEPDGMPIDIIQFNAPKGNVEEGQVANLIYNLGKNTYRGKTTVQLMVDALTVVIPHAEHIGG